MDQHSFKTVAAKGESTQVKGNVTTRAARTGALILLLIILFAISVSAQTVLARVPVPSNDCCQVAVNVPLNKVYVSGGYQGGQDVFVINGRTFKGADIGTGSTVSVDIKNDNYWAATVYAGGAVVRKGRNNSTVATVTMGDCPVNTAFDCKSRREWVGAQCGNNNDPLFVVDADKFNIIAGPIGSGGVMGATAVNPATGRLYMTLEHNGGSKRVNPITFAVTTNAFGSVETVDPVTSKLYAISDTTLQIIDGNPDPEVITASVALGYSPGNMGVNNALGHLYLANPGTSSIEVRDIATGALITTFPLGAGVAPYGIGVDSTRGRLYVGASTGGRNFLYAIEDLSTVRTCLAAGTC